MKQVWTFCIFLNGKEKLKGDEWKKAETAANTYYALQLTIRRPFIKQDFEHIKQKVLIAFCNEDFFKTTQMLMTFDIAF